MYNHQLDTFMVVAETKSFAAAAKKLYISSSAVFQQIAALEKNLKIRLFDRSGKTLKLTEAGEYLYEEVPRVKDWDSIVRSHLEQLKLGENKVLRIGVPKMHKSRCFYELWTLYSALHPGCRIEFAESSASEMTQIFEEYEAMDLLEFIDINASWQKNKHFLELGSCRMIFGVPLNNPLSQKSVITFADIAGQTIYYNNYAFAERSDEISVKLRKYGAAIVNASTYSSALLDQCAVDGSIIVIPECSASMHPMIRPVAIDWDVTVPYGFFYSDEADQGENSFIRFVHKKLESGEFVLDFS